MDLPGHDPGLRKFRVTWILRVSGKYGMFLQYTAPF
jgi:hypothetical protein